MSSDARLAVFRQRLFPMGVGGLGALALCGGRRLTALSAHDATPPAQPPGLRDLADAVNFQIGCEVCSYGFAEAEWRALMAREFNLAVIDWGVYWPTVEPRRGHFDTRVIDRQLSFARRAGQRVRGHPLVFPSTLPDWLRHGGFGRDELLGILETHIQTLVSQYRGVVHEWVVVNEPYTPPHITDDIFHAVIGDECIELAFRYARRADPTATLIFNHNRNHTPSDLCTARTREIVNHLAGLGLVDRVGVQMHLDAAQPPTPREVAATLGSYAVPACVTEFDVSLQSVTGTRAARYALQATIAGQMLSAARASGNCHSFTVWTIGDEYSYYERDLGQADADATLFDDDLNAKPAYAALRAALT